MAIQEQALVQAVESPCPPMAVGQANPIQTRGEAMKRDDCPSRNVSFMERFLYKLRLSFAVPHS